MAVAERKKKKGSKETEDSLTISILKFKQTNKHLFGAKTFQFCFKLYKLPSLGWPPKEAAGSLENGRSREEEEEGKQGDGGHRTEDADDLEICCSKVQPQQRAADGFCAYAPPEPRFCTPHHIAAAKNLLSFRRATRNSRPRSVYHRQFIKHILYQGKPLNFFF